MDCRRIAARLGLPMAARKSSEIDPIDVQVGLNIKRRRRDLGMSQTAIGDVLGVSFQQVQKYENGMNRVSASMLQKIADVLGVPVASLFPPRPAGAQQADVSGGGAHITIRPPDEVDLGVAFAGIESRRVKKQILALVQAIAEELR